MEDEEEDGDEAAAASLATDFAATRAAFDAAFLFSARRWISKITSSTEGMKSLFLFRNTMSSMVQVDSRLRSAVHKSPARLHPGSASITSFRGGS